MSDDSTQFKWKKPHAIPPVLHQGLWKNQSSSAACHISSKHVLQVYWQRNLPRIEKMSSEWEIITQRIRCTTMNKLLWLCIFPSPPFQLSSPNKKKKKPSQTKPTNKTQQKPTNTTNPKNPHQNIFFEDCFSTHFLTTLYLFWHISFSSHIGSICWLPLLLILFFPFFRFSVLNI